MRIEEITIENGITNLNNAVVAIYKGNLKGDKLVNEQCLGSGFMVIGQDFQFMTAKHVLDFNLVEDEALYLVHDTAKKDSELRSVWGVIMVTSVELSTYCDLAFGKIDSKNYPELTIPGFKIASSVNRNANIMNIEYSAATGRLIFQSIRKGNIVYCQNDDQGVNIMETSFPCLKGASGSPVVDINDTSFVIGVMIQNVDHELAPTQIIRATGNTGELIEEVKYLLPQGLAISAYGVREALKRRQKQ